MEYTARRVGRSISNITTMKIPKKQNIDWRVSFREWYDHFGGKPPVDYVISYIENIYFNGKKIK